MEKVESLGVKTLRGAEHGDPPPRRQAEGAHDLSPRPRLRGSTAGDDGRRLHRLIMEAGIRRAAPGDRGQGGREDRGREPDARHGHLPELLPPLPEARRHDRHRRHRGRGVQQDLQARRERHPHEQADDPDRLRRPGLQVRAREVRRGRLRDRGLPRARPAGAGGHHLHRKVREASALLKRRDHAQRLNAKHHEKGAATSRRRAGTRR